MALVTCEKIGESLVDWLEDASSSDIEALCDALEEGCDFGTDLSFSTGDGIELTGDGSSSDPYDISIKTDSSSDNAIDTSGDGAFVENAKLEVNSDGDLVFTDNKGDDHNTGINVDDIQSVETDNTDTVDLSGDGTSGDPLEAKVNLSGDSGNLLQERSNGLYYGIEAPPDTATLYVDAVDGHDDNVGNTKSAPLKTIHHALTINPTSAKPKIRLREGQVHEWKLSQGTSQASASFIPYGPTYTDAINRRPASGSQWLSAKSIDRPTVKFTTDVPTSNHPDLALGRFWRGGTSTTADIEFRACILDTTQNTFDAPITGVDQGQSRNGAIVGAALRFVGCIFLSGAENTVLRSVDSVTTLSLIGCYMDDTEGNFLFGVTDRMEVKILLHNHADGDPMPNSDGLEYMEVSPKTDLGPFFHGVINPIESNFTELSGSLGSYN